MTAAKFRTGAALLGFLLMVGGISLQSVSWALTVGGSVVLLAAILGEMRSKC